MAKDGVNSCNNSFLSPNDSDSNKSFVKKVKARVSGFIPSSLSKWFSSGDSPSSVTRQREEDEDDEEETFKIEPPLKKAKLPLESDIPQNSFLLNSVPHSYNPPYKRDLGHNFDSFHNSSNRSRDNCSIEPVAGPSGIKSKRTLAPTISYNEQQHYAPTTNVYNGDKDSDSGESTSGYSSMIKISHQRENVTEKGIKSSISTPVNPRQLFNSSFGDGSRSLFTNRSLSPQTSSSLSSRRPSFNSSTFGSPNLVDRTLVTERIVNSPFYSGRTIYGGASAYSRQLGRSTADAQTSLRKSIQVKPSNESVRNGTATLSKTAQRILDTLEQYATPVTDVKKIPNPSVKRPKQDGLLFKYVGTNPYVIRESKVASNRELQVPTVPDLLKMKLKEKLQDSTVAVRQIATNSKSTLNAEEYKIRSTEDETPKHTGKMKTKITSVRQKESDRNIEEPKFQLKLPDATLQITTLPKFDFVLPPPSSYSKPTGNVTVSNTSVKEQLTVTPVKTITKLNTITPLPNPKQLEIIKEKENKTSCDTEYKFANPLVLAENIKSIIAINDFKFSDPVCQKLKKTTNDSSKNNFKLPEMIQSTKVVNSTQPNLIPSSMDSTKKSDTLPSLSSMFKPAAATWECSVCMIRNPDDKTKCAACETPKGKGFEQAAPKIQTPISFGFGNQFKMSADKWECPSCMVRNNKTDTTCVACGETNTKKISNGPVSSSTTSSTPTSSFGDKFKPPVNTWECTSCMIRNKSSVDKCIACETPKQPTGFGDAFKKKATEWECESCMLRNPMDCAKCMCCEADKPGAYTNTKVARESVPLFAFGIDKSSTPAFTFGIPPAKSTEEKSTDKSSATCVSTPVTMSSSASFAFGVKPATTETFTFGVKPVENTKPTVEPVVKPSVEQVQTTSASVTPTTSSITFGTSSKPILKRSANNLDDVVPKKDTPVAPVIFGMPKANQTSSSATKPLTLNGDVNKAEFNSFGAVPKPTEVASTKPDPPVMFGVVSSTKEPEQAPSNLFNFAVPATTTLQSLPAFGTVTNSKTETAPSLFKFSPNSVEQPEKPTTFGSGTISSTSSNVGFGNPPASSIFGSSMKTTFDASSAAPPAFGSSMPSGFGGATRQPAVPEVKPFTFDSGTDGQPLAKVRAFTFGQNTKPDEAKAAAPMFNFGSAASAAPSPTNGGFNFSAPSSNASGGGGGFSFNLNKPDTSFNAQQPNMFGATAPPVQNGLFNFGSGSANSNTKAGFSFGGTSQSNNVPAAAPGQGIFNFGAPATNTAPPPGGFGFGTNPPPAFNFLATPSDTNTAVRKKIRAVRRSQPQR